MNTEPKFYYPDRFTKLGSRHLFIEPTNDLAEDHGRGKYRVELEYGVVALPCAVQWYVVSFAANYLCNTSFPSHDEAMEFFNSVTPEQLQSGELA